MVFGMTDAAGFPDIIPDDAAISLVQQLIMVTYAHNREGRQEYTEKLDAIDWEGALLLLAAAKQVLIERHLKTINAVGREQWIKDTAASAVSQHADWLRLRPGQMAAMLRSGLGDHDLAKALPSELCGRLDATVVAHLLGMLLDPYDSVATEVSELLDAAEVLTRRRAFADEFE